MKTKITSRQKKLISEALSVSTTSTYSRIKIGAVVTRGSRVVGKGANLKSYNPEQKRYNDKAGRVSKEHALHAELNAILKARNDKSYPTDIYVARWDRKGRLAMCRPCPACMLAIKKTGIKSITYTTSRGIVSEKF